ncbi:MAG TPA: hypothetical protein PLY86_20500 [bacterium]|nr:hypothetical protein [bacterium]
MTEHECTFVPIPCLSPKDFFDAMKPFEDPPQEPSGPTVRSKKDLPTAKDRAHFILEHGSKAYLSLPRE